MMHGLFGLKCHVTLVSFSYCIVSSVNLFIDPLKTEIVVELRPGVITVFTPLAEGIRDTDLCDENRKPRDKSCAHILCFLGLFEAVSL